MTAFFDTNVLVYAVAGDRRQLAADRVLAQGGLVSAQVLNEFANVAHKKLRKSWIEIEYAIQDFATLSTLSFPSHGPSMPPRSTWLATIAFLFTTPSSSPPPSKPAATPCSPKTCRMGASLAD